MSSPNFSDYVTTETVMQAFAGAKDLAQAGATATVQYVQADAIATLLIAALAIAIFTIAAIVGVAEARKQHDSEIRAFMVATVVFCWAFLTLIVLGVNREAIPRAINPAGSIIYKAIVKGGAQ